jgi:transposase InsO family protein
MLGDPCRPRAQGDRFDRRSVDLFILRGIPAHIRSDNGPEFVVAKAAQEWIAAVGAKTAYIERGQPLGERLHRELQRPPSQWAVLREAQIVRHYNTIRPHASIGHNGQP